MEILTKKIDYNKNDSFWYYGDQILTHTFADGSKLIAESAGEQEVQLEENGTYFRGDDTVVEADNLNFTDEDLHKIENHDGWRFNNWFAIRELDASDNCSGDDIAICHDYDELLSMFIGEIEFREFTEKGEVAIERDCCVTPEWTDMCAVKVILTREIIEQIKRAREVIADNPFLLYAPINAGKLGIYQLNSTTDDPDRRVIEDRDFITDLHILKVYRREGLYLSGWGKHDGTQFWEAGLDIEHLLTN